MLWNHLLEKGIYRHNEAVKKVPNIRIKRFQNFQTFPRSTYHEKKLKFVKDRLKHLKTFLQSLSTINAVD